MTMNSWLVTVLLLASAANGSGGAQQVPITSYTCTQPNTAGFNDHRQCTVSRGRRTCAIQEGAHPALLSSSRAHGVYAWRGNTNPFVVLDIPQGWCVGSVRMTFVAPGGIPALSLSVHSAERLSTNTDRTAFSLVSEAVTRLAVMNLTTLASGKYLRINMTEMTEHIYLREIEVFGTNDSICTHPSSAGGDPASPTTSVTPASPTTSVTPASPTTSVTPASPTTSVTPASPTTSVTPASSTTSVSLSTSDNSTTSGPSTAPFQSPTVQSPSPSPTPGGVPVAPDSYVLPAAISAAAMLLVVVLTAIFVVVICIITRRRNIQKSIDMHRLSIHYRGTQKRKASEISYKDDHLFVVDQSAEVPIHDANGAVDKNHNGDIRNAPRSYAALGPSESNDSVFQGAAEEPVAEGAISRPTSQASIRSNEVSSKLTYGRVTWVHPSTLDHPYDSCNREIAMAASAGGGHYEPPPQWPLVEGPYDLTPDCKPEGEDPAGVVGEVPPVSGGTAASGVLGLLQECRDELSGWDQLNDLPGTDSYDLPPDYKLTDQEAAADGSYKLLKDANGTTTSQGGTPRRPPPPAPLSVSPVVDSAHEDGPAETPRKEREPDPISPTYASVDPPSGASMLAAVRPFKHSSRPEPSPSAQHPCVPQEDHIYSEVDKPRKKSASSTSSLPPRLTHSTNAARVYSKADKPHKKSTSSASSTPANLTHSTDTTHVYSEVDKPHKKSTSSASSTPANLTHSTDTTHIYSEVDMSRKKSASSETSHRDGLTHTAGAAHVYSEVDESRQVDGTNANMDALDADFWGGSGNAEEGDVVAQPQSITSSTPTQGAVPTQEGPMDDIYTEIDHSKKKKKSKKSKKK